MKINKINKKYIIAGIFILILLIVRSFLLKKPNDELIFTVTEGSLVDIIHVSGTYRASAQTKIISPTKGIISELYVVNNEEVDKGDSLFHIESTATDEEKAIAYSNYQNALNQLKISKQNKESSDATMWTKHNAFLAAQINLDTMNDRISRQEDNPSTGEKYTELEIEKIKSVVTETKKSFDSAEKQFKEADSTISSAQAAVNSSKLAYDGTKNITIKASVSGKVVNLLQVEGDEVFASTATSIAQPVLVIANLNNPYITAKISEAYISRLVEGQKVKIVFDGITDKDFVGYIKTIDTVGTELAGIVTYNARISIDDFDDFIKPNMSNTVIIETFRKDNIFSVPNSAIFVINEKSYVKEAGSNNSSNSEANLIKIELGAKGLVKTEIINGVYEGLEIVADIGL